MKFSTGDFLSLTRLSVSGAFSHSFKNYIMR